MSITHAVYALADALLLIGLIVLVILHVRLKRVVYRIRAHKPSEPSPAMIRDWQKKLKMYPEGSPKHIAYRNRLASLNALPKE